MWLNFSEINISVDSTVYSTFFIVEYLNNNFEFVSNFNFYGIENLNVCLHNWAINSKKIISIVLRWIPVSGAVPRFKYEKHFQVISDSNLWYQKYFMHFWSWFFYKKYHNEFLLNFVRIDNIFFNGSKIGNFLTWLWFSSFYIDFEFVPGRFNKKRAVLKVIYLGLFGDNYFCHIALENMIFLVVLKISLLVFIVNLFYYYFYCFILFVLFLMFFLLF